MSFFACGLQVVDDERMLYERISNTKFIFKKREHGTIVIIDIRVETMKAVGRQTNCLAEMQVHMNDIEAMAAAGWRRTHLST